MTSHSLGIIIWQFISGKVPYDIDEEVLPENQKHDHVLNMIKRGDLPGALENIDASWDVLNLIGQCWNKQPLLRPTAASVAESLLDIRTRLSMPVSVADGISKASLPAEQTETKPGPGNSDTPAQPSVTLADARGPPEMSLPPGQSETLTQHEDLDIVKKEALQAINEARKLNVKSPTFQQSRLKISKEKFHLLTDDDSTGWTPTDQFLAGALIWWNLSDAVDDELSETHLFSTLSGEGELPQLDVCFKSNLEGAQQAH